MTETVESGEKAVFWKTVVELRNKLESKTEETNRLEKQIENQKKHYKTIEDEIVVLRDENAKHVKDAQNTASLQAEAKNSRLLADNLKKEVGELRTKYDKAQNESSTKITELRHELEGLNLVKVTAENAERKVQQLKKENEAIAAEANRTRQELEQKLKSQMLEFQQKMANQESESDAVFKQRYTEMKEQLARLQKQLEESEDQKEDVRGNMDGQIQSLRKENAELRHQIEDLNDELSQKNLLLKREIERRNAAENELAERQEGFAKDNKKLKSELESLRAEKEELTAQTNTFQKRKHEMSMKEKEFSDARDAASDLRKQNQQLQQRVNELEDELENISKSRQSQKSDYESAMASLQAENQNLISQNMDMKRDFEESQRNLQTARQKAKQQYAEELSKTKMEQQNLDMENILLKQKLADLEFQIEKIVSERERLADEFKNIYKQTVSQLENELEECNRLLRQFQSQSAELQEVLVGNDTMSIKLHLQQMEEVEGRLRELYKEHHAMMEENENMKRVVGMYKLTCRELRLKVGQSMAELLTNSN